MVREEAGEEWEPRSTSSSTAVVNGKEMKGVKTMKVVRPLRDMGTKECAAWAWWNGLEVVGKARAPSGRQGIGGLTKGMPSSQFPQDCCKLVLTSD